ncbi:MAG: hypothetical protein ACRDI2_26815, partial [Chloroflexota bacterium]
MTWAEQTLLRRSDHLVPAQARSFIRLPFAVPEGAGALRIRFAFEPARAGDVRNLLTLSLFDPHGFRGAGHRHAPQQEILLSAGGATPGFIPGALAPGEWLLEIDCHCVLYSDRNGVDYELDVAALSDLPDRRSERQLGAPEAQALTDQVFPAARAEGAAPYHLAPGWEPDRLPVADSVVSVAVSVAASSPASGSAPRWLKGDLHVHTNHSDGRWTVDDLARYI